MSIEVQAEPVWQPDNNEKEGVSVLLLSTKTTSFDNCGYTFKHQLTVHVPRNFFWCTGYRFPCFIKLNGSSLPVSFGQIKLLRTTDSCVLASLLCQFEFRLFPCFRLTPLCNSYLLFKVMCLLGVMFQVRNRSTSRVLLSGDLFCTQPLAGTLCLGVYLVFRNVIFVRCSILSE